MSRRPCSNVAMSPSIAFALRVLIASYFLASVGLINGPATEKFMATVLPAGPAGILGVAILYITSFSIMIGWFIRPAALLLAVFVFWVSYVPWIDAGSSPSLEEFWRDIVMVASLVLIATTQSGLKPHLRNRKISPRRVTCNDITTLHPRTLRIGKYAAARNGADAFAEEHDETDLRNVFA